MTNDQKNILRLAIQRHGARGQMDMCVEEMAELIQALNKIKRLHLLTDEFIIFPSPLRPQKETIAFFNLCSEIADVEIMIHQLKEMLCQTGKEAIEISKERKILRLQDRLNKP